MLYNLHLFSSKCRLFNNATLFGFCITHILNTGCAKIWKKFRRQKVKQYRKVQEVIKPYHELLDQNWPQTYCKLKFIQVSIDCFCIYQRLKCMNSQWRIHRTVINQTFMRQSGYIDLWLNIEIDQQPYSKLSWQWLLHYSNISCWREKQSNRQVRNVIGPEHNQ